jgi:hypothetical protein
MRNVLISVCLAASLGSCSGGGPTLTEYAEQSEVLATTVISLLNALDAEWESQEPTLEGARDYWARRVQARVDFLEGIRALEPPDEVTDLHARGLELFSRLTAAEQAVADRVAASTSVPSHGYWWDTPEGRTARAIDEEAIAICRFAQEEFDATQEDSGLVDVAWIPTDRKEVVRVAFGCPQV